MQDQANQVVANQQSQKSSVPMGFSGKGGNARDIIIAMMKQMSQTERFIKKDDIMTMLSN